MRTCVICGAAVRNMNPRTTTCDPVCTRARRAGRTRQQEIEFEEKEPYPGHDGTGCQVCGARWCVCAER